MPGIMKKNLIPLDQDRSLTIYAGSKVSKAFEEVTADINLYKAAKLSLLLEAAYVQGQKDGRRHVFEIIEKAKDDIPHRLPGRPKKRIGRRRSSKK